LLAPAGPKSKMRPRSGPCQKARERW
jgi:hypothetical protein